MMPVDSMIKSGFLLNALVDTEKYIRRSSSGRFRRFQVDMSIFEEKRAETLHFAGTPCLLDHIPEDDSFNSRLAALEAVRAKEREEWERREKEKIQKSIREREEWKKRLEKEAELRREKEEREQENKALFNAQNSFQHFIIQCSKQEWYKLKTDLPRSQKYNDNRWPPIELAFSTIEVWAHRWQCAVCEEEHFPGWDKQKAPKTFASIHPYNQVSRNVPVCSKCEN